MFGTIAYCRGVVVAIRKFSVSSIDLNKKNLLELKQVLYMIYHIFHLQSKVNKYYKLETFDFMYMNYIRGPVKRNSRPSYIFHYLMHQYWYDKFHFICCKDIFGYPIVLTPPSIVRSKIFMNCLESILKLVKHRVKLTLTVIIHYLKVFQYLVILCFFFFFCN